MPADAIEFVEHHIDQGQGKLHARDYPGAGPAFVLMHGFPDNLHIWDDLVPFLAASGRRVVTFDFLGFGASDKPDGAVYSFAQQLGDLGCVVDALELGRIVPVAHDSSGMAALNFALKRGNDVAEVVMLNSAYSEDASVVWPELITLFATASMHPLAAAIARSPEQFGWLLSWQQTQFVNALPDAQKAHFNAFIGPLIGENFTAQPGAGPAFAQLAAQFFDEHERNAGHVAALLNLDLPVKLIWGRYDPYISVAVAERRRAQLKRSSLTIIPAGHWLQSDEPALVAKAMLS